MKNTLAVICVVLISVYGCNKIFAQDTTDTIRDSSNFESMMPAGLSLSNQVKYSNDNKKKQDIFEGWLNLDYRKDIFSAGIRLVSFQPKDPAVSGTKRKYTDIDYKYFKVDLGDVNEGATITLGNYYVMFGRGMILKSYENRNIRIDNNLLGAKFSARYKGFVLTALSGMPENSTGERKDILYAADLEYGGLGAIKAGVSFAFSKPDDEALSETRLASLRTQTKLWNFDLYGEYGIKQNDDENQKFFNGSENVIGEAGYGSVNFFLGSFSFMGEYRYYDNFQFQNYDNSVSYNTPPSGRKDYSYILLNRHPSSMNQNNEKGFQVEFNYDFADGMFLSANYGITKSLASDSYYQRKIKNASGEKLQLKEGALCLNIKWDNKLSTIATLAYNEEAASNTKNITPVLENKYYLDDINTLRLVAEHQQTRNNTTSEKYYQDVLTFEYLRAPKLSLSVVAEMDTHEPIAGKIERTCWSYIQVGYNLLEGTDVSVLIGSRQAGAVCIGGVCRYEPEFRGIELKMLTSL